MTIELHSCALAITNSSWFEPFLVVIIVSNFATLAAYSPMDPPDSFKAAVLRVSSHMFLGIFTCEAAVRMAAHGLCATRGSYLVDKWTRLDAIILALSWLPVFMPSAANLTFLRLARVLRPLRMLKFLPGMTALIDAIFAAAPTLGEAASLLAAFFLLIGIVGVQSFKGAFHRQCVSNDENVTARSEEVSLCNDSLECAPGEMCQTFDYNPTGVISFDDIGAATLNLFRCITFDSWTDDMYLLMPARGPVAVATFFVVTVVVGGFFLTNIFLAIIYSEIVAQRKAHDAAQRARFPQAQSKETQEPLVDPQSCQTEHYRDAFPEHQPSALAGALSSEPWEKLVQATIVFNTTLMCLPYANQSETYAGILSNLQLVCTAFFGLEMLLKMCTFGCREYWGNRWNAFDGTIVMLSTPDLLSSFYPMIYQGGSFTFLRALRITRVLRMVRALRRLMGVIDVLTSSTQQLVNLGVILALFVFMYAMAGIQLFGGKQLQHDDEHDDEDERVRVHFDYFFPAVLSVIVGLSGSWAPYCAYWASASTPLVANAYFLSLVSFGSFFVTNLYVGVLLDNIMVRAPDSQSAGTEEVEDVDASAERTVAASTCTHDESPEVSTSARVQPKSSFRYSLRMVVKHPAFEGCVITLILLSSMALALSSPRLDKASRLPIFLEDADAVFVLLFSFECGVKITAFGFREYLQSAWNIFDFSVALSSAASLILASNQQLAHVARSFRVLRVIRPLRLLGRSAGMRRVMESLVKALPAVSGLLQLLGALGLLFSILGMQMFQGRFAACTDLSLRTPYSCIAHGHAWENPPFGSFDDIGQSMLLMFVVATGEDWEDIMFHAMDAVDVGVARSRNDFNYSTGLFFVSWIFLGSFIGSNVFVGQVTEAFFSIMTEEGQSALLTVEQQQWVNTMNAAMDLKPLNSVHAPSGSPFRLSLFRTLTSQKFELMLITTIMSNAVVMSFDYWGIERNTTHVAIYEHLMSTFVCIYCAEAVLKILAFGCAYFKDTWNLFDLSLAVLAVVNELPSTTTLPFPPSILRLIRLLRVLRIFRLLRGKHARGMRSMLMSILRSIPALLNVLSLTMLLVFSYAVLGMQLFGRLHRQDVLTDYRNFDFIGNACLLLFQVMSGDAWSVLMRECMLIPGQGTAQGSQCSYARDDCGSPVAAVLYFCSFMILTFYVLLNVLVAVVVENFNSEIRHHVASPDMLEHFIDSWARLDPDQTRLIRASELHSLIANIPAPMGTKGLASWHLAYCRRVGANIPVTEDGQIEFFVTLDALVTQTYITLDTSEMPPSKAFNDVQAKVLRRRASVLDNIFGQEAASNHLKRVITSTTNDAEGANDNAVAEDSQLWRRTSVKRSSELIEGLTPFTFTRQDTPERLSSVMLLQGFFRKRAETRGQKSRNAGAGFETDHPLRHFGDEGSGRSGRIERQLSWGRTQKLKLSQATYDRLRGIYGLHDTSLQSDHVALLI